MGEAKRRRELGKAVAIEPADNESSFGEITIFHSDDGNLIKPLTLSNGMTVNDAPCYFRVNGSAARAKIAGIDTLTDIIGNLAPNQAYALGRLDDRIPASIRTVDGRNKVKGDSPVTARPESHLVFKKGAPGVALLDINLTGMPDDVKQRVEDCGGVWAALCKTLPSLETTVCVDYISALGKRHILVPVCDASDIPRFITNLHERLWLNGFGWMRIAAGGSTFDWSLIDKGAGSPERLNYGAVAP